VIESKFACDTSNQAVSWVGARLSQPGEVGNEAPRLLVGADLVQLFCYSNCTIKAISKSSWAAGGWVAARSKGDVVGTVGLRRGAMAKEARLERGWP